MNSDQIELQKIINDIFEFLYTYESLTEKFSTNFFYYFDEFPIDTLNIDIKDLVREYGDFLNFPEVVFTSFLKTLVDNNLYYETSPSFLARTLQKAPVFIPEFEKSVINLSQSLDHSKCQILLKVIKKLLYILEDDNFLNQSLYWFVVGDLFANSNWYYNRPSFLLNEIESNYHDAYDIITHLINARKHYNLVDLHSVTRIYGSSIRALMNEFGLEHTLTSYLRHYREESNKTVRFAFHNSYINVLKENSGWGDMVLSSTSAFIRIEPDLGILMKVLIELKKIYSWNVVSYISVQILERDNVVDHPDFLDKFYFPYKTDILLDNRLIFSSFDIFVRLWQKVDDEKKHELLVIFKDWVENTQNSPTTTIKKVFLESLIVHSTEIHWIHLFNQINEELGPARVSILDEPKIKNSVHFLDKSGHPERLKHYSDLDSVPEGLFCLGCRRKLNRNNSSQNQCGNCLAIFCDSCYDIWLNYKGNNYFKQNSIDQAHELTCLGSSLYGFTHNYVAYH